MPPRSKPVVVGTAGVQKKKFRPSHKNLPDGPWKRKLEKEKKNFVQSIKTKKQYAKIKAQVETEIPMRVIRDIDQAETKTKTKANQISKNTHEVELDGSDDNVADEDLDEESFDEALTSGSDEQDDEAMEGLDSTVDSKEDVSANEEDEEEETEEIHKPTKVLNDDPNDTTHPSRKHTKANPARPGYFDKQLKKAEEKKRVIEERKAAIEAKKEERDNAILARQKRRQDFGRALNGGDRGGFGGRGRGNLGGRGGGRGGRGGFSGRGGFGGRGGRRDNVGADGKRKLGRESEFLLEKVKRMVGGGH